MREVEDDYIAEEILGGFDVSLVFVRRNKHYYDFRKSIKTKEDIRDIVGDVDDVQGSTSVTGGRTQEATAKVVAQLERWWDKYKVSLHELDMQVADAETKMKGFLEELGYE